MQEIINLKMHCNSINQKVEWKYVPENMVCPVPKKGD